MIERSGISSTTEASGPAQRRVFHSKVDTIRPTYGFEDVSLAPGTDTVDPADVVVAQDFCGIRLETPVLVVQLAERQDAGVRLRCMRELRRAGRPPEQRQAGRVPNLVHRRVQRQRLGSLLLRGACRFRSVDGHDDGDAVALGDGLAEAARPVHVSQFWPNGGALAGRGG